MKSVYPVHAGPHIQYVPGIPAVPHLDIGDKEAKALVDTGAFTYDEPPDPPTTTPAPNDPPNGGSSDS